MFLHLANKFILKPSTDPIPVEGKTRREISFAGATFEVWRHHSNCTAADEADICILKFPGTGGRAERATGHPAECWSDLGAEVWAVNPPGYGQSGGRASVSWMPAVAAGVFEAFRAEAAGRRVVVTGNSLGTLSALYVAAKFPVDGLLLRNPPPLRELIIGKHGWWNLGVAAKLVARHVPAEMCTIKNAAASDVPALFVMSGRDALVPPPYQQKVLDAYRGEHRVMHLPRADHATAITEEEEPEYVELLNWLKERTFERHGRRPQISCSHRKPPVE